MAAGAGAETRTRKPGQSAQAGATQGAFLHMDLPHDQRASEHGNDIRAPCPHFRAYAWQVARCEASSPLLAQTMKPEAVPRFAPMQQLSRFVPSCLSAPINSAQAPCIVKGIHFHGKEKHININKFAGLSRDWAGGKILFMCFLFFFGSFLMGEKKTHKQNCPQIPGQSRETFVYVFFSLCVFFAPHTFLAIFWGLLIF